jgi:hypothetical protein
MSQRIIKIPSPDVLDQLTLQLNCFIKISLSQNARDNKKCCIRLHKSLFNDNLFISIYLCAPICLCALTIDN